MIAVKAENVDKEEYKKISGPLPRPRKSKKYIPEKFAGTKVEVKKPVSEVWGK